jgi:hypothetical protein
MPTLTRRRSDNPLKETWHVYYGDVPVGMIGERSGAPVGLDQWKWTCGFYPGQHKQGTATTFEEARAGLEADWNDLLPELPEDAFDEYRRDRAKVAAIRARGERLPSEIPSSLMRCV